VATVRLGHSIGESRSSIISAETANPLHGHRTLSTLVRMTDAIRLCLDMLSLEATITGATVADLYHPLPAA